MIAISEIVIIRNNLRGRDIYTSFLGLGLIKTRNLLRM